MVAMSVVCGSSCAVKPVQSNLYDNKCAARNAVPGQRHLVNSNVCNVRVYVASHRISTCGPFRRLYNFRSNAVAEQSLTANSAGTIVYCHRFFISNNRKSKPADSGLKICSATRHTHTHTHTHTNTHDYAERATRSDDWIFIYTSSL